MAKKPIDFPKRLLSVPAGEVDALLKLAVLEDLDGTGDITTASTFKNILYEKRSARVIAKEYGVVCGTLVFKQTYAMTSSSMNLDIRILKQDGERVERGEAVVEIHSTPSVITTAERIALNFLGLLSGVSTKTRKYADLISGSQTKLLDTRKTIPGLRLLEKYAVAIGGGYNHRMGLYDMALIKDNHIAAVGSLSQAVRMTRESYPGIVIEVETSTLEQVKEALSTQADIVMLDNMDNAMVKEALKMLGDEKYTEVSGNVDEKRLVELAGIGVDFVSMGALTHTVKPLDLSMLLD